MLKQIRLWNKWPEKITESHQRRDGGAGGCGKCCGIRMQLKSPSKAGSAAWPCHLCLGVSFYFMNNLMWLLAYLHVTEACCGSPHVPRVKSQVMAKLIQPLLQLPGLCTPSPSLFPGSQGGAGQLPLGQGWQQGRGGSKSPFLHLQQVRHETSTAVTLSSAPYHCCPCWPSANELERANSRGQKTAGLARL